MMYKLHPTHSFQHTTAFCVQKCTPTVASLSLLQYTMATLVRDCRSPGTLLTKATGHLLKACGYRIWYWGCKIDYMGEFDGYGGRLFGRAEFWQRWDEARSLAPPERDVEERLRVGEGLVPPLPG